MYIVVYQDIFKWVDRFVYVPYKGEAIELMIKLKKYGINSWLYEEIL